MSTRLVPMNQPVSRAECREALACLAMAFTLGLQADTALVFNEVMYHPVSDEPAME